MKRCRSWLLLYAALIGLVVGHVSALRATSLIFGKQLTTTTTTTTTTSTTSTTIAPATDEQITEESSDSTNSSKPVLTGIPQIDYIWDPNLPRELNGFNLTSYPFLVTVPATEAEIGFKCAGLHDGFYASIKWNCQLYHHCLYGVRYDFLCANFTAFDQKTFICHFVSEVDCKNSAKYWFRNDALYVATTTTTTSTTPAPVTQPSISATPARPYGSRPRRPFRRRPQIDYYEEDYAEEYDDPPPPRRRKNQKPRNRRPDFDDYTVNTRGSSYAEDDQYEARPVANPERNRNRQEDDYAYERPVNRNRNKANRRKPQYDYEDRPLNEQEKRRKASNDRRKVVDDEEVERRPAANDRRKYNDERRISYEDDAPAPKRKYEDDYEERPIRKNNKPPAREEVVNDAPQVKPTSSGSSGGGVASLFNNPRRPPKISRPVPLTEKKKFEYTPSKAGQGAVDDSEYYDDYEEPPQRPARKPAANGGGQKISEPPVRTEENTNKRAVSNSRPGRLEPKPFKRPAASTIDEEYDEDEFEERNPPLNKKRPAANNEYEERIPPPIQKRPLSNFREKSNSPTPPLSQSQQQSPPANRNRFKESQESVESEKKLYIRDKYSEAPSRGLVSQSSENPLILKKDNYNVQSGAPDYRDYTNRQEDNEKYVNVDRDVGNNKNTNKQQKAPIRTPYDEPMSREDEREARPIVRVVKRPFLPSRGGSPYLPRGLQPVGNNARQSEANAPKNTGFSIKVDSKENTRDYEDEQPQEQSKVGVKRKPTLDEIYDSEYDVTLNDALNPTLKPLTSNNNRYQSTSYSELTYAPSHIRRTHLNPPITLATTNRKHSRIPVTQLDSYEEDYDY